MFARIKEKEVHIVLEQSAKEFLIEKGYDPQYGARPMRRAVERYLEDPFAEELLRGNMKAGDVVHVTMEGGKLTFRVADGYVCGLDPRPFLRLRAEFTPGRPDGGRIAELFAPYVGPAERCVARWGLSVATEHAGR